jgi:peroxiredoxin
MTVGPKSRPDNSGFDRLPSSRTLALAAQLAVCARGKLVFHVLGSPSPAPRDGGAIVTDVAQGTRPVWPPTDGRLLTEVMTQGPVHSYTHAFPLENMLHATPLAGRPVGAAVAVGDPAPDFVLVGMDGVTRTLADFWGKPLVLRLSRAVSELLVCPLCTPGLQELNTLYGDFEAAGLQLAVVFSTDPDVTARIPETQGLSYSLHSDPTWDLYRAYGTGHVLLAPRQAWAIVDGEGIVRWVWRLSEATGSRVPLPSEVLTVARELFES